MGAGGRHLVLHLIGLLERQPARAQDALLHLLHGQRPVRGQLAGELQGPVHQLRPGHDVVQQPHLQSLRSAEGVADHEHLHRLAVGNLTRQAGQRAAAGQQSHLRLGRAEDRVLRRHAQVDGVRQLGAAAERAPVHGRDHRLVELEAAQDRVEELLEVAHQLLVPLVLGLPRTGDEGHGELEVAARTEVLVSGAGEDRNAQLPGVAKIVPGRRQLDQHLRAQAVLHLRTVHGQDHDPVASLDEQVALGLHLVSAPSPDRRAAVGRRPSAFLRAGPRRFPAA